LTPIASDKSFAQRREKLKNVLAQASPEHVQETTRGFAAKQDRLKEFISSSSKRDKLKEFFTQSKSAPQPKQEEKAIDVEPEKRKSYWRFSY